MDSRAEAREPPLSSTPPDADASLRDGAAGAGFVPHGLTIRRRLGLIVLAVAVPMLALSLAIAWRYAERERESSRQAILYASRSILGAVDAELGKNIAVAQTLAASPSLQAGDLRAFRSEAERAMDGVPGAWVALADAGGQHIVNTRVTAGTPLPRVAPTVGENLRRAFATGQIQIPDVVVGPVAKVPVISVGVPVFRDATPAYYLQVAVQAERFRDLLDARRMPDGWLIGVADRSGRFVARSRDHDRLVGQPISAGWHAIKDQDGIFDYVSLEGHDVTHANSVSGLSGWAVGVAVEKGALEAPMRQAMLAATVASAGVTLLSLLLAGWAARRITSPIGALTRAAGGLQPGEPVEFRPTRVPEVDLALHAFDTATKELIARERALIASETRFRHLFDDNVAALLVIDPDLGGAILDANPAAAAFYGWSRDELRRKHIGDINVLDSAESAAEMARARSGEKRHFEFRHRLADGSTRDVDVYSGPVPFEGRTVLYSIIHDVTGRRQAEAALRESERRRVAILEALPIGVSLSDAEGRTLVSNSFFRRFVPELMPSRDDARRALWEARDDKGRPLAPDDFPGARALRGESVWPGQEFLFRGDAGQAPLWTRVAALPFRDEHGAVAGAIVVIVDIDQEKRAAEERRTLQAELLHVSRLSEMGQMAAALAHELNQPLTAVAVYVGGCQRLVGAGEIDAERRDKLGQLMQMIADQALRAGEIIRQLRDFVRKGTGERRLESAAAVIREASTLAITAAKHEGVAVQADIDAAGEVFVNKVQIQQVVFNLVRNAIEAMERSDRKQLAIMLRAAGDRIECSVADTGTGLAPEIVDRLFLPFSSTKSQGMGIGLSVCRNIVEAHQGRIWAEPNPGGGTVFRFSLPRATREATDAAG